MSYRAGAQKGSKHASHVLPLFTETLGESQTGLSEYNGLLIHTPRFQEILTKTRSESPFRNRPKSSDTQKKTTTAAAFTFQQRGALSPSSKRGPGGVGLSPQRARPSSSHREAPQQPTSPTHNRRGDSYTLPPAARSPTHRSSSQLASQQLQQQGLSSLSPKHSSQTATSTQLSVAVPPIRVQKSMVPINTPQRVPPPPYMQVPGRVDHFAAAASSSSSSSESPKASSNNSLDSPSSSSSSSSTSPKPSRTAADSSSSSSTTVSEQEKKVVRERIKDYLHRAQACGRAGRKRNEAHAHFCIAVLLDNICEYARAIEHYSRFAQLISSAAAATAAAATSSSSRFSMSQPISSSTSSSSAHPFLSGEDKAAQALAHNSMGVAYLCLGPQYGKQALFHHRAHREMSASDLSGQFAALTNLGLVYMLMGENQTAAQHHQAALKCAQATSNVVAQSIALGNLGLTGYASQDMGAARACMERHAQLSASLADHRGQLTAFSTLGKIASTQGEYKDASKYFEKAMRYAKTAGDRTALDLAKVHLGVARGAVHFEEHMKLLAGAMLRDPSASSSSSSDASAMGWGSGPAITPSSSILRSGAPSSSSLATSSSSSSSSSQQQHHHVKRPVATRFEEDDAEDEDQYVDEEDEYGGAGAYEEDGGEEYDEGHGQDSLGAAAGGRSRYGDD